MALRRRTQAWSPADLPPEIVLGWWDARHVGPGYADAAAVSLWLDRSGRGRDLAQATGAAQPTFRRNGLIGLPSVRFDGGDRLTNSGGSPFHGLTKAYMAFVFSSLSINSNRYVLSAPSASGANGFDVGLNGATVPSFLKTDTVGATALTANLSWANGAPFLAESMVDLDLSSNERTIYAGNFGIQTTSIGGATVSAALGEFNVGDFGTGFSAGYVGDLHEVLICGRPLVGREGDLFRRYCWQKWGAAVKAG